MAVVRRAEVGRPRVGRPRAGRAKAGPSWLPDYIRRAAALDTAIGLSAAMVAFIIRFGNLDDPHTLDYLVFSGLLPLAWVLGLAVTGTYQGRILGVGAEEFRRVLRTGFGTTACVAVAAYGTKTDVARGYVVLALPLATLGTLAGRYLLRKRLHRLRARGRRMHRTVVVGHAPDAVALVRQLRRQRYHGMVVVGACVPGQQPDVEGVSVVGDIVDVGAAVEVCDADTVTVLASPELNGSALRGVAWQLEETGAQLMVSPGLIDVAGPRTTIRPVAGLPLMHVEHPELAGGRRVLKTVFDRFVTFAALVLLAPVLLAVAIAVRATTPGPAFFRQTRIGKEGRPFTFYKFRTMRVDADAMKASLRARNEHDGVLFKIRDDPRVTPLGRWLRRYSLDELPQLANVLAGQMSLVGPRPPLPDEVARYGDEVRRRLVVKPGLTGLWQISGRSDLPWDESVRLDLHYVENWSLSLDMLILWKTWSTVIRATGAY